MSREPVPTLYRCPRCYRVSQWTDGTSVAAGDERDEFWCQTCGKETPLEYMEAFQGLCSIALPKHEGAVTVVVLETVEVGPLPLMMCDLHRLVYEESAS